MNNAARSDSIGAYLRQLGRRKRLTREQEHALLLRVRNGDRAARQALARSNLLLVVAVARKYAHSGARLDDLIQEGNLGLMKSIEHFDPKRNVRFATYAIWWVRDYVSRFSRNMRSQVRGGVAERRVADFSLDETIGREQGGAPTYLDRLQDDAPNQLETLIASDEGERVRLALAKVRKRIGELGWAILQERLTQAEPRSLEELGFRWGVSRERVRQLELRIKALLTRYLSAFNENEETTFGTVQGGMRTQRPTPMRKERLTPSGGRASRPRAPRARPVSPSRTAGTPPSRPVLNSSSKPPAPFQRA